MSRGRFARSSETGARIVELLRHGAMTVDDLAEALALTRTAVRAQLTLLIGRGLVEPVGLRKGSSKPAQLFAVTREAEQEMSRAYVPVLTELIAQLARQLPPREFTDLMAQVGHGLGSHHAAKGTQVERIQRANRLLLDLGALTTVTEEADRFVILGKGCPLSAATGDFPQACAVIAGFLAEVVGQPVGICCERYDRKRCCFEVARGAA